jgi:hypothetical protein
MNPRNKGITRSSLTFLRSSLAQTIIIFGLISLQGLLLKWIIKRLNILGGH